MPALQSSGARALRKLRKHDRHGDVDDDYRFRAVLEEQRRERLLKGITETPVSKGKGF